MNKYRVLIESITKPKAVGRSLIVILAPDEDVAKSIAVVRYHCEPNNIRSVEKV